MGGDGLGLRGVRVRSALVPLDPPIPTSSAEVPQAAHVLAVAPGAHPLEYAPLLTEPARVVDGAITASSTPGAVGDDEAVGRVVGGQLEWSR